MNHHSHSSPLVILSVIIAIFASYTALDFALNIKANKNKVRKWPWLLIGSIAMGIGIWSMHFIGMLAFHIPDIDILYNIYLLILSILVSIGASFLSLHIMSKDEIASRELILGSLAMGTAISGMHYIGIWAMIMPVTIIWDYLYVIVSIVVSIVSSAVALLLAFKLKDNYSLKSILRRLGGASVMGFAISSMHYMAMAAMSFKTNNIKVANTNSILASDELAAMVIICTLLILGISLITTNIDRAFTEKNILNESLAYALIKRDEFFNIASHELKTPLTSLKLQIQMVLKKMHSTPLDEERIRSLIFQADISLNRMTLLIDDMLDIARLTTGKLSLQPSHSNLNKIILNTIEKMSPLAEEKGNRIIFKSSEEVHGSWDQFRLEQVFMNLIANAIRYAPGSEIHIKLWKEGDNVLVSVKDFGVGIAKKDFQNIFERYERLATNSDERGLGLGLYIVKQMVDLHEGEVMVESEVNQGATFTISLPIK